MVVFFGLFSVHWSSRRTGRKRPVCERGRVYIGRVNGQTSDKSHMWYMWCVEEKKNKRTVFFCLLHGTESHQSRAPMRVCSHERAERPWCGVENTKRRSQQPSGNLRGRECNWKTERKLLWVHAWGKRERKPRVVARRKPAR